MIYHGTRKLPTFQYEKPLDLFNTDKASLNSNLALFHQISLNKIIHTDAFLSPNFFMLYPVRD